MSPATRTPGPGAADRAYPTAVAGPGSIPAWAPDYLKRAEALGQPHGPEHACFLCASLRQCAGSRAVEPDYADLFSVRWMA